MSMTMIAVSSAETRIGSGRAGKVAELLAWLYRLERGEALPAPSLSKP